MQTGSVHLFSVPVKGEAHQATQYEAEHVTELLIRCLPVLCPFGVLTVMVAVAKRGGG